MADQRDEIAQALMAQNTGGLTPQDFATFSKQVSPEALQGWLDKGGVYGQMGMTPPDPDEQYFARKGPVSGSPGEVDWLQNLQPWQGGVAGGETTNPIPGSTGGFIGAGGGFRANPSYWGWQGPHQGYAPNSMGDLSGFNGPRGGAVGGTGGLTPADFATFSRLVSPAALQDWLNAGGVQGQFGGSMGGSAGGGGGGSAGGSVGSSGGGVSGGGSGSGVGVGNVGRGSGNESNGLSTGYATIGAPTGPAIGHTQAGPATGLGMHGFAGFQGPLGTPNATQGITTDAFGNPMSNGPFGAGTTGFDSYGYNPGVTGTIGGDEGDDGDGDI